MKPSERYALIQIMVRFYSNEDEAESIRRYYKDQAEIAIRKISSRRTKVLWSTGGSPT